MEGKRKKMSEREKDYSSDEKDEEGKMAKKKEDYT